MTRRPGIPALTPQANGRLVAAAIDLLHAANLTPVALTAIAARIAEGDDARSAIRSGWGGGSSGSGISDPTAAAALPGIDGYRDDDRARLDREQLRDDIGAMANMARDLRNFTARLASPWGVAPQALCDGRNYEGYETPWTPYAREEVNGWSNVACDNGAGRSKLCPTCLVRMNRWRERHGLERISDAEEVAA